MLFYYIFILLSDDNIYVINIRYLIKRPLSSILIKLLLAILPILIMLKQYFFRSYPSSMRWALQIYYVADLLEYFFRSLPTKNKGQIRQEKKIAYERR